MQEIKNIIFDLGGIFLDIDLQLTKNAFSDLGFADFSSIYSFSSAGQLFEDLETGKITEAQFYDGIRGISGLQLTDEQIRNAWNALLLRFPPERISWLIAIKEKYKVYLFSNTNKIHYDLFSRQFSGQSGGVHFNDYFIKAWYSHEVGMRKPYPQSFSALLEREGLVASETLFIDDTLVNIEGAEQAGLKTIHLVPPRTVLDLQL